WSQLGPSFVAGQEIAIAGGNLEYLLDVNAASRAPRDELDLEILQVDARSEIVELSEQKFFAPAYQLWDFATQGPPPNILCNLGASMGYQAFERWTGVQICGLGSWFPDEQVFYDTATRGPVNDPSSSPSRVTIYDG